MVYLLASSSVWDDCITVGDVTVGDVTRKLDTPLITETPEATAEYYWAAPHSISTSAVLG